MDVVGDGPQEGEHVGMAAQVGQDLQLRHQGLSGVTKYSTSRVFLQEEVPKI